MWLIHSAKGTAWKKHKYIRIENGQYIYENSKKAEELAKHSETLYTRDGKIYKPEDVESSKVKTVTRQGGNFQYTVEKKMRDGTTRSSVYNQSTIDSIYPKTSKEKRDFNKKKVLNKIKSIGKYPKETIRSSGEKALSKLGLKKASDKGLQKAKSKMNAEKTRRKIQRF